MLWRLAPTRTIGQRVESSLGLLFYNARFYDPLLARFIQADTIVPGGVQGLDRYAYVNNNPLKYTDPSGHAICDEDGNCTLNGKPTTGVKFGPVTDPFPTTASSGMNPYGSAAYSGMSILIGIAKEKGITLSAEDWLAYIIATEYYGSIGNSSSWNEALARRYRTYCSDGAYSASCFNGFWGYMQALRTTKSNGPDLNKFNQWILSPNGAYLSGWQTIKGIAEAIQNPNKANGYGINSSMNTCDGSRCDWVLITAGNSIYPFAKDQYQIMLEQIRNGYNPTWLIWYFPSSGYDLLLTVDQVKELCGGSRCNLANK
jgi:RHS repeat-associated protein